MIEKIVNRTDRISDIDLLSDELKFLVKSHIIPMCEREGLPFKVFETARTPERQAVLLKTGVSWTKNSKHLIKLDKEGRPLTKSQAVDLVLYYPIQGKPTWSWANIGDDKQKAKDLAMYVKLVELVEERIVPIAKAQGLVLVAGGNWPRRDYPHFQIGGNV